MLIQGNYNVERQNILINEYCNLINKGVETDSILFLVLNSYKKQLFINKIKEKISDKNIEFKILTSAGLCYNAFIDNWNYILKITGNISEDEKPNLCGLEISQYIFKKCIKEADFSDYISKINLLHQLFRRYSLIVQNNLTAEEIEQRSEILKEAFLKDAKKAIDSYKLKTIELKSFDYLRQSAILPHIYNKTNYFNKIKYLFIDDADELSYSMWKFIDAIIKNIKEYYIAYDKNGSGRCGYLCAYKSGISEFKSKYCPKEIILQPSAPYHNLSDLLYTNINNGKKTDINNIKFSQTSTRFEMINTAVKDINTLIKSGIRPEEISIISPIIDEAFINTINEKKYNLDFQIISGCEKLINTPEIKYLIIILKAVNNIELRDYEIKNLLINLLKIPFKKYINNPNNLYINNCDNSGYIKLINIINSLQKTKNKLSEQIKIIFENIIKEYQKDCDIKKYEFLLKEAVNFENTFKGENIEKDFILQIENSIISENPIESIKIKKNSIIIATPQKIIDYSIKSKYQFWLDISSNEWFKEDTGTLYNAWVFGRDWNKKEYSLQDNIELTRDKAARIIRKLMLCCEKEILLYAGLYDNNGNENFKGLTEYINTQGKKETQKFKIIPRDDQKPVMEYKRGRLGIIAVPGAGKTTILMALIIKLMESGIKGSNIFVLTYMESAAKNFKERIQSALPNNMELPNISTIHGLALRIIKENSNYIKAGLDEDFQICDDSLKEKIIKELFVTNKINEDNFDNYLRCISLVKLSEYPEGRESKYKEIKEFFNFYTAYNKYLKKNNLIDYDDMLYYAVKILKENKEILKYYQNLCEYIIEDEAQDSTNIQQTLLNLLGGKHNNIVRCGDINQAITSTFTNSDTAGFKEFIQNNKKIEMTSSQRCSQPIYSYANDFIKKSINNDCLKSAFYNIEIRGTNNNPQNQKKPEYIIFETEKDEKQFILDKIKSIQKENPKAAIGILLRLNSQVNEYNEFLLNNNIKTSVKTDNLSHTKIFKIIYSILKVIQNPLNKETIKEAAKSYISINYGNITDKDIEYINQLKIPFIHINPDEIETEGLNQLYWDIEYWLNNSTDSFDIMALKIGLYYAKTDTDKANTYIISTYIKRIMSSSQNNDTILSQLEYYADKPLSLYKLFEDTKESTCVEIMTTHKSKGDEFDYVFLAQMNEDNYPVELKNVKLKNSGHFTETIKSIINNSEVKTPDILKREQIYETLRLIYVGITRAKQELYITTAKSYLRNKKVKISNFIN